MEILALNAFFYVLVWLSSYYVRRKNFDVFMLIWSVLTFNAIMGYVCVDMGCYYFPRESASRLSVIPYMSNFVANFILCYPFFVLKNKQINIDLYVSTKGFKVFVLAMIALTVAYSLLKFSEAMVASAAGFGEAYEARHSGGVSLVTYSNPVLVFLNGWGGTMVSLTRGILLIYFVSLIRFSKKRLLPCFGIGIVFAPAIASSLSSGSKGGLFFTFFGMLFYYILAKRYLPKAIDRKIQIVGLVMAAFLIFYVVAITVSRNEASGTSASFTIIKYLGESMPNLGFDVWDKVKYHPMGERFFPEFFGIPSFDNMVDRFAFWTKKTGITEAWFTTFWGDCYVEFGYVGSFVFLVLFVFLWQKLVFKNYMRVCYTPLIVYYFNQILLMGVFDYNFYEPRVHKLFIFLIIVCVYLKLNVKKRA